MNDSDIRLISDSEFVVIDVETTGQRADIGRITEIGMIKVVDGEIIDEYSTLINPEQFIPPFITQLTGITNEMVFSAPKFSEVKGRILNFLGDSIFTGHNVAFDFSFVNESFLRETGAPLTNQKLCTCKLARRLLPILKSKSLESLIHHFSIEVQNRHRALDDAKATTFLLNHFIEVLENRFEIETLDDLLTFQNKKVYQIKKPPKNFTALKDTLSNIPELPGVYSYFDKNDDLIYIGKAKNLKDRVNSYFYHNTSHSQKVFKLVREVWSIKHEITGSELSALLLEAKLIKKFKPHFNSAQKRVRKRPFLKIDLSLEFPFLEWTYEFKNDGAEYFGPFINRYHVESFIDILNKTFLLRECKDNEMKQNDRCIYPDLSRCIAPCKNNDKEKYWEELAKIRDFLGGKSEDLLAKFESIMKERANNLRFEEAADLRDRIKMIKMFREKHKYLSATLNNSNFIVIVPSYRTAFEIFFVKNGKYINSVIINEYNDKILKDTIRKIFLDEHKFSPKYADLESSQIQILTSWVYQNYNDIKIINLHGELIVEDVINEIKSFLKLN